MGWSPTVAVLARFNTLANSTRAKEAEMRLLLLQLVEQGARIAIGEIQSNAAACQQRQSEYSSEVHRIASTQAAALFGAGCACMLGHMTR